MFDCNCLGTRIAPKECGAAKGWRGNSQNILNYFNGLELLRARCPMFLALQHRCWAGGGPGRVAHREMRSGCRCCALPCQSYACPGGGEPRSVRVEQVAPGCRYLTDEAYPAVGGACLQDRPSQRWPRCPFAAMGSAFDVVPSVLREFRLPCSFRGLAPEFIRSCRDWPLNCAASQCSSAAITVSVQQARR